MGGGGEIDEGEDDGQGYYQVEVLALFLDSVLNLLLAS